MIYKKISCGFLAHKKQIFGRIVGTVMSHFLHLIERHFLKIYSHVKLWPNVSLFSVVVNRLHGKFFLASIVKYKER